MAVQFITGRSGAGKTYTLISQMIEKSISMSDYRFVAVVPEQYSMETQKEILSRHPRKGCFNIEVTSMTRLAYAILEEQGVTDLNVMDELGKTLVIRKILHDCKDELKIYKNKTSMMGFTDKIKSVISEFRQYNINDESLSKIQDNLEKFPGLKIKLNDLRIINNSFNEYIENKAITNEDLLSLLCTYIPKSDYVKNTYFYFDSFTGFTPIQYKVIEQLMKYAPHISVTVTLPECEQDFRGYDKYELFSLSKETIVKIRELAIKNSIDILPDIVIDLNKNEVYKKESRLGRIDKALSHIEEHIFRDFEKFREETDAVRILELNNPKAEADYVAGEIAKMIKSGQYRYNDFAVITGDIEGYYKYIKQAFYKYDIPCFIDHKDNISTNKYVDGILAAIEVIVKDFSHQSVMRLLRLDIFDIDINDCDIFENYILKSNRRGYKSYKSVWEKKYAFMEEEHINIVNNVRLRMIEGIEELREALKNKNGTVLDKTKALYMFTVKHNIQENIADDIEYFKNKGLVSIEKEYSQIPEAIINVFNRIVALMGNEIISNQEYMDIISAGFLQVKIGIIPPGMDTVMVGNIERTRLKDTKSILFFVGMNDTIVPKTGSGGIITDNERDVLKNIECELAPTNRDNIFKQRIYLYSLFAKPLEKIILTYSQTDKDGASLRKSYIISTLLNMFPMVKVIKSNRIEISPKYITNKKAALSYLAENMSDFRKKKENKLFSYLAGILLSDEETKKNVNMIMDAGFYNNEKAVLKDVVARKLYGIPSSIGVTRLEGYAGCAYSQFLSYGLKLKEREKFSIKAYDIGNLYHMAIMEFFKIVNAKQIDWHKLKNEQSDEIINQAVNKVLSNYENEALESSARNDFIISRFRETAKKTVRVLVDHIKSGKFEPTHYEIQLDHGIVDRIDTYSQDDNLYVKVIDYKSGRDYFDIKKAYYGMQMQLLVYLKDAMEYEKKLNNDKNVLPAAGLYFNIDDPYIFFENASKKLEEYRMIHDEDARDDEAILRDLVYNEQLAQFQMSGIVNMEENVLQAVDEKLEESNKSQIVKVSMKKDGNPDSRSQTLDQDTYIKLINHVADTADKLKEQLLSGNIDLNPTCDACSWCAYKGICRFDTTLGDKYKELEDVNYNNISDYLEK